MLNATKTEGTVRKPDRAQRPKPPETALQPPHLWHKQPHGSWGIEPTCNSLAPTTTTLSFNHPLTARNQQKGRPFFHYAGKPTPFTVPEPRFPSGPPQGTKELPGLLQASVALAVA